MLIYHFLLVACHMSSHNTALTETGQWRLFVAVYSVVSSFVHSIIQLFVCLFVVCVFACELHLQLFVYIVLRLYTIDFEIRDSKATNAQMHNKYEFSNINANVNTMNSATILHNLGTCPLLMRLVKRPRAADGSTTLTVSHRPATGQSRGDS